MARPPAVAVLVGLGDGSNWKEEAKRARPQQLLDDYDSSLHENLKMYELLNQEEALARGKSKGGNGVQGFLTLSHAPIDGRLLDELTPKVVSNYGVGVNHIDLQAASARKIPVGNTPGVLNGATADAAWCLAMAARRRVLENVEYVRAGKWKDFKNMANLGLDVFGCTVGIIGMGRIGYEIARRAHGFDCPVLYFNRTRRPAEEEAKVGARLVPLDTLLSQSDIVILSCPLTRETTSIIDARALSLMKPTATLVNISRGPTVCTESLTKALQEKRIANCGLDVTNPEPLPVNHPLMKMDNVIILPHRASATVQCRELMRELCLQNLEKGLKGEDLVARCNL